MKTLDLNAVISDTESTLRRALGNDVRMTAIFASSLDPVRAEAKKLQQILLRLAVHARQAMPAGGRFSVETKNVRLDEDEMPNLARGAYVLLAVSHTGVGMNDAAMQRIFDPVAGTGSHPTGQSVELCQIPVLLQKFGGHVLVENHAGAGVSFRIFLPRYDKEAPSADTSRYPLSIPQGNETILLVEDEDSVRSLLRILLHSCGYQVLEAVSADEAMRVADDHRDPIDLVITDIVLQQVNGRALVDHLLAVRPGLKVLLISGYSTERLTQFGCGQSNFAFLQKPFKCEVLGNLVRQLLDAPIQATQPAASN